MTDRRYGVNKYGDGKLYGFSDAAGQVLGYGLQIDWNNDGILEGSEGDRLVSWQCFRGRRNYVRPNGQGYEPLQTGTLTFTLDNYDGRYDGWNQNSPLYPNVTYGLDVSLKVRDLSTTDPSAVYPIFYGVISDITPTGYGKNAKVTFRAKDGWQYLRDYTARVAVSTDITPDAAIDDILDYIGWPSRWGRSLATNADNIKYFWANGNKQAASVIKEITDSFVGYFYIDNTGQAVYKPRSDIAASAFDYSQDEILKDIGLPQPYEIRRNTTRIKSYPRTIAESTKIWQLLGDTPAVQPGTNNPEIIWANYTYNDIPVPAQNVVTPVASSDYTMNSQADGGGTNVTSDFDVALQDLGDTAKLTITNNGASVGYITKLEVNGDAIYLQNNADIIYPATDVTQPREFFLDLPWQQNVNVAKDFGDLIGPFMDQLNPFPIIQVEARPEDQFTPDLFDIVSVSIPKLGITGDSFRVGGIEHKSLDEKCNAIQTRLYLESYVSFENFWVFPIADFGTDTVFGA